MTSTVLGIVVVAFVFTVEIISTVGFSHEVPLARIFFKFKIIHRFYWRACLAPVSDFWAENGLDTFPPPLAQSITETWDSLFFVIFLLLVLVIVLFVIVLLLVLIIVLFIVLFVVILGLIVLVLLVLLPLLVQLLNSVPEILILIEANLLVNLNIEVR